MRKRNTQKNASCVGEYVWILFAALCEEGGLNRQQSHGPHQQIMNVQKAMEAVLLPKEVTLSPWLSKDAPSTDDDHDERNDDDDYKIILKSLTVHSVFVRRAQEMPWICHIQVSWRWQGGRLWCKYSGY